MIVLYNPVSSASRKPHLPMSLLALGAMLEEEFDYRILDGNLLEDPGKTLAEQIESTAADILGVTVMPGPQLRDAVPICRRLKERFPSLTIVWGGYFPTMHIDPVIRAPFVDYAFRGHCEHQFPSLVRGLRNGCPDHSLAGLAGYEPSGRRWVNPMPPLPDLDELPDFPYHRLEMEPYIHRTFMGTRKVAHHSSYGCPFKCNFCGVVSMVDGGWRPQSAERTAAVTRNLVGRFGVDVIEFHDSNFFVSEARVAAYCERIHDLGIAWWAEGRLDTLLKYSDRTWELMRDSGLRMVYMGAESGSEAALARMNKGGTQTPEKTLEIAAKMAAFDIIPEMSFMLGCPPDPEADVSRTIQLIRRLKRVNPEAEVITYLYTPVPVAGDLLDEAEGRGFRFPSTLDEWVSAEWREFSHHTSSEMPWLRPSLHRRVFDFERVLHAAYPPKTDYRFSRLGRALLRALGSWRYRAEFYRFPLELRVLGRMFSYQRPELEGF